MKIYTCKDNFPFVLILVINKRFIIIIIMFRLPTQTANTTVYRYSKLINYFISDGCRLISCDRRSRPGFLTPETVV